MQSMILCALFILSTLNRISILALNQEGLYLQRVKNSLTGPPGFLSDWLEANTPCNWTGVTCNSHMSVVSIVLTDASLSGSFPLLLCRLPSLSRISLDGNSLGSTLSPNISDCRTLTHLTLAGNYFYGQIPSSLSDLRFLRHLDLGFNSFSGKIPASFGYFQRLESLVLIDNLLEGPAAIGNITTLKRLVIGYNKFRSLSPELGNLTNLEELWISDCNLMGEIPDSIGMLSRLENLDVSDNELTGGITSLLQLKSIRQMELYNNSFSGDFPSGWSNLTKLRSFDASMNALTGTIPDDLCELPLASLNLYQNKLQGLIPKSIAKSPNLYELKLFDNQLTGSLPSDLGKNSALRTLDVSFTNLSGEIPKFLCHNGALVEMVMVSVAFTGIIPQSLGQCHSLRRVRMRFNMLHGEVPAGLWGLPHVFLLDLQGNAFSGNISHLIIGAKNLSTLSISNNKFSGSIPTEIGSLDTLAEISAGHNQFSGGIPSTIVNLYQLWKLDLSCNYLSGGIPNGIGALKQLGELNLANNELSGPVPDEIGSLPVLNYLDLSQNNLSGSIPLTLQNLKLNRLNLSNNKLTGFIPPLFYNGVYRYSFLGNPGLCTHDSVVCNPGGGKGGRSFSTFISLIVVIAVLVAAGVVLFVVKYKKLDKDKKSITLTKWMLFHKLDFDEYEISECLKESNIIGRGGSSKVYKVDLSSGETVAVKKLDKRTRQGQANFKQIVSDKDEFEIEVGTLGNIRHKNIVKLWCCCDADSYKFLVYEYMPNGSLGDLLHGKKGKMLDWPMRFKIALDTAEGLSYLHHDSVPPIVHRDVKSNNILLDEDFRAKLSDFGVAKVVRAVNKGAESMSVIAGSYGYIAPEYAYTLRVNEKSDIYSFGIVILELVTGKQPVDPVLGATNLATWICRMLDCKGINHVIDPELDLIFKEHICKVLNIGLLCTSCLPMNRPSMRRVVLMLQDLSSRMPPGVAEKRR